MLTQDPIGLAGGVNLYAYAGNNPVGFSDPFGLCPEEHRGNCTQAEVGAPPKPAKRESFAEGFACARLGNCDPEVIRTVGGDLGRIAGDITVLISDGAAGNLPQDGLVAAGIGAQTGSPNQRLTTSQATELAEYVGYNRKVKNAPFNSHGQPVFSNGKRMITPDVDAHSGGVWKMFDRQGKRLGTYDALLETRIGN